MKNEPSLGIPIEISIAYGWAEHDKRTKKKTGGLNAHWKFLKEQIKSVVGQVLNESKSRVDAEYVLKIRISRLRARHGAGVLKSIKKRIKRSDILIFDISGKNPNVLFELGYAMAIKGTHTENIFVLTSNPKTPSDLQFFMRTEYTIHKQQDPKNPKTPYGKIRDSKGFRSALLSSIKELARERSMWGKSKETIEWEDQVLETEEEQ
jgi:hypothetical protein